MDKIKALEITKKALKTRKNFLQLQPHQPVCPYVLCEAMGIDLRFIKIPSFEGMYVKDQNMILISSDRPEGRKRFTCAHELGHHILNHGTIIDEILENGSDSLEEQEADFFASMLLMPSSAVSRAFQKLGIDAANVDSVMAYTLSKYFGVSYLSFITHLHKDLHFITLNQYLSLKNAKLAEIRFNISGMKVKNQIFNIGKWWEEKAIELEVGDIIVSEIPLLIDGPPILESLEIEGKYLYKAISSGISRVFNQEWSCFVKSSKSKFQGLYQYKFDEEPEE